MKETEIRKYAGLMKELGLTGLDESDGSAPAASAAMAPKDYISVKSPIVGVFYAAPAENADPYVSIGDNVAKGQTLCVVEAMKLMNEIAAEEDGVISGDLCCQRAGR